MTMMMAWGRGIACTLLLAALAACNHDSSPASTAAQASSLPSGQSTVHPSDAAPQISGTPGTEVAVGQSYSFTPKASDANGDSLTFSISGKPTWASFNTATGQLSGTPGAADVGSHEDIEISVSDGQDTVKLAQFAINVVQQSNGSVTLAWMPPTENTDGSPLTALNGYKIHYGTQSGQYTATVTVSNGGVTRYVIESLSPGTYYFAITAVATSGAESDLSGEASKTI